MSIDEQHVEKVLNPIARMLADSALYETVAEKSKKLPSEAGFEVWENTLNSGTAKSKIEQLVKAEMDRKDGAFGKQVWDRTPANLHKKMPEMTSAAASWGTRKAIAHLRAQMVKAHEWKVGYLLSGDSLPGMPLKFHKLKNNRIKVERACRKACLQHIACRGFTYHPKTAVCYLKAKTGPARGTSCATSHCWYHGMVIHPKLMDLTLQQTEAAFGLKVHDKKIGNGATIKRGDTVTIKYVGKLDDGSTFDSGSYVFMFQKGQVILGDDLGLQGMRVGGTRQLTIPPYLGYGTDGYPGSIPPNAVLHFNVTLTHISHRPISSGYKVS
jgi:hypothetical protein